MRPGAMMDSEELLKEYSKGRRKKYAFIIICVILAVIVAWFSLVVGTRNLSMDDVVRIFINHINGNVLPEDEFDDRIIWEYRVPRALLAIIAGCILALSGTVMQSVMKNPLADPYTTGVSSGAVFGMAVAAVLGFKIGSRTTFDDIGILLNAVLYAMVPVLMIILMSPYFRKSPSTLILAGVATSYLFSSLTAILMVTTSAETLAMVYHWEIGNLAELGWMPVYILSVLLLIGAGILWPMANKLNLMSLDDKDAKALGLDGKNLRILCLVVLSFITASVVAFTGIIGFVGLVIPHIVRLVLGSDNKFIIPAAMAFGAFFLLACDCISRMVDLSASIPIGVVTSFIGAPIFLFLIIKQKKSVW